MKNKKDKDRELKIMELKIELLKLQIELYKLQPPVVIIHRHFHLF